MRMNAEKFMQNTGGQVGLLRPYTKAADKHEVTYVAVSNGYGGFTEVKASDIGFPFLKNATGLPVDAWKAMDKEVMGYQDNYRSAFRDVINAGLVKDVSKFDKLFYSQKLGAGAGAVKDMDGVSNRKVSEQTFDVDTLPLFVTHADYSISWRDKGNWGSLPYASGGLGIDWDSSKMEEGVRQIERKNEEIIFDGYSVPYAGNYVYGYTNFSDRNQTTLTYTWSTATAAQVYADVKDMWEDCFIDNFQPFDNGVLYVAPADYPIFVDDYNSYMGKTLAQRVLELKGIERIEVSSYLSAGDAVLVRLDGMSTRIIRGTQGIVPVMWFDDSSRMDNLTLMSIQEPQLRADAQGYTSITHGNKA